MKSEDIQGVVEAIRQVADGLVMLAERSPDEVGFHVSSGLDNLGNALGVTYPHPVGTHHGALVVKFRWDGPMFILGSEGDNLAWQQLSPPPDGEECKP